MASFNVGDIVQFNYKGNSEVRKVHVEKSNENLIVGMDELRDGRYRSFNLKYISNARVVGSFEVATENS